MGDFKSKSGRDAEIRIERLWKTNGLQSRGQYVNERGKPIRAIITGTNRNKYCDAGFMGCATQC